MVGYLTVKININAIIAGRAWVKNILAINSIG